VKSRNRSQHKFGKSIYAIMYKFRQKVGKLKCKVIAMRNWILPLGLNISIKILG
jgi:hypothetical protein